MLISLLRPWVELLRTIAIAFGVLLSFVVFIEIARAFVFLRELSPWLAAGFAITLAGAVAWFAGRFFWAFSMLPRAPAPPVVTDIRNPTPTELQQIAVFLRHRVAQLRSNPRVSAESAGELARIAEQLSQPLSAERVNALQNDLNALLEPLDGEAERLVQECVRDVMIAVVFSPYRSVDLLVVLFRNGQLALKLAQHYQTQPAAAEQWRILKDVITIVATVNLLNFAEKFVEKLFASVPILGGFVGDLSQGVGAGLLTSAAGHAAIRRCRSVEPWSRQSEQDALAHQMPRFIKDLREIVRVDILPRLQPRIADLKPVSGQIVGAFDAALEGMNSWIWRPLADGGSAIATETARRGASAWSALRKGIGMVFRRKRKERMRPTQQ